MNKEHPLNESRRYMRSGMAFLSCFITVPAVAYIVALILAGNDVRFTKQANFWLPLLVASVLAAAVVFPAKRMSVRLAALLGPAIGLVLFAGYAVWLDL
jgi:hypothetical protein